MREIPLLKASDMEARIQSVFNNKKQGTSALLLLYKSARTDMRILDEVFGPMNWKRSHEVVNGALLCTISVWDETKGEWVSKQDVGVPSNRDSVKGEASDSFKRAGFNWGIGRELYDAPAIFVELNPDELYQGKVKSSVGFSVREAVYSREDHEFKRLVIVDRHGNARYTLSKGGNAGAPQTPARQSPAPRPPISGPNSLHEAATQKAELIRKLVKQFKAHGIVPDQFAMMWENCSFNDIPLGKLENLDKNFDRAVNWYLPKACAMT